MWMYVCVCCESKQLEETGVLHQHLAALQHLYHVTAGAPLSLSHSVNIVGSSTSVNRPVNSGVTVTSPHKLTTTTSPRYRSLTATCSGKDQRCDLVSFCIRIQLNCVFDLQKNI